MWLTIVNLKCQAFIWWMIPWEMLVRSTCGPKCILSCRAQLVWFQSGCCRLPVDVSMLKCSNIAVANQEMSVCWGAGTGLLQVWTYKYWPAVGLVMQEIVCCWSCSGSAALLLRLCMSSVAGRSNYPRKSCKYEDQRLSSGDFLNSSDESWLVSS